MALNGRPRTVTVPRARRVEPAEQVQQRRLARARAPHDRDALAGVDLEVDAEQHRHRLRPLVGLRQVLCRKQQRHS